MTTRTGTRRLVTARAVGGRRIEVGFDDGTSRTVDVAPVLRGPVFERIASDDDAFAELYVDADARTVCWPGEIDLAPELFESLPAVRSG